MTEAQVKANAGFAIFVYVVVATVLSIWAVDYTVGYWTWYLKGTAVDLPIWADALLAVFFGSFFLPAAVATLILGYFLT